MGPPGLPGVGPLFDVTTMGAHERVRIGSQLSDDKRDPLSQTS